MKIHRMTASFGALQNEILELNEGLNIVCSPNESGKSTWCGFIKSMLFGVDSSAREKGGVKPDKVRFAPWSGDPMAGSMEIEYEGRELCLLRQGRESTPMRDFTATIAGTNDIAKDIPATAVGETLTGVSRDVFERSAFIGQGKVTVGGSPELEKRIAAIVQTGEETASVSEVEERLKTALRRRRYNRNGRLPEIEHEMVQTRERLAECEREARHGEELKKAKRNALEHRDALLDKVSEVRSKTRHESLEKLSSSRSHVKTLEREYSDVSDKLGLAGQVLDSGVFGREEPKKSRQRVNIDKSRLKSIEDDAKHGGSVPRNITILVAFAIIAIVVAIFKYYIPAAVCGCLFAIQLVRLLQIIKAHKKAVAAELKILELYSCKTADEVEALLSAHEQNYELFTEILERQRRLGEELTAAKKEQAELDAALLKDLDFIGGDSDAARYTKLLEDAENTLRNVREESALWEGKQSVLGDFDELAEKLDALTEEHRTVKVEFDALTLALETLRDAGNEIQHRLTPQLSKRTAEIFACLTGARYDSVLLDRELKAAARLAGDTVSRDSSFLSAGTIDQLYLAVRLAICELALPPEKACPLILDDALVNFDDERCGYALELLRSLAKDRQIILFTCHGREADLMYSCSDVFVTRGKIGALPRS
ncbi:MAG: AAA family ATPase [Oscillospiraceae bacterium]